MEKALIFSPPPRKTYSKKTTPVVESLDVVVLAPFTKTPRLVLDTVLVGHTSTTFLAIQNPSENDIKITICPPKLELALGWDNIIINAFSQEVLSISWTPNKVFSGCSVIKIQADNGMKKDVSIILKSTAPTSKVKKVSGTKGCIKKVTVSSTKQQNDNIRKVLNLNQRTICSDINQVLHNPKITNTNNEKLDLFSHEDKENISNNTTQIPFNELLDASEFCFSRVLSQQNKEESLLINNGAFENKIDFLTINENSNSKYTFTFSPTMNDLSKISFCSPFPKDINNVQSRLESSLDDKITQLCFTPVHPKNIPKKCYKTDEHLNSDNTYTLNYKQTFCKDTNCIRVSSPINLSLNEGHNIINISSDNISKESIIPTNETYQLNLSSSTYTKCVSPEVLRDVSIDEYINDRRNNTHNLKKILLPIEEILSCTNDDIESQNCKKQQKLDRVNDKILKSITIKPIVRGNEIICTEINNTYDTNIDPFMFSTMFYDEQYFHEQELHIQKWLNALLQPPVDLQCDENNKINLGKLWNNVKNKPLTIPQTRESISQTLHTNHRLQSLRISAGKLFRTTEIVTVISKCIKQIENEVLSIRADKQLHLDIGLQKYVMELFLCYNPLWLRIGLETICNEELLLSSNSDIHGLSLFILNRIFRGQNIKGKSSNIFQKEFAQKLKKFVLKKFLMLVLFLDKAKKAKIISHDPCLFAKNAEIKESREILLAFTKELIAGIGDITRHLKTIGYVVTHKQSFLDEFNFAVKNLAIDIRDGVRLAKITEIICLRNDLISQLRAPAISRLQKLHNVKVSFTALEEAGFILWDEINPRDIIDGHKEKTLSLFWHLIYKFQAPLFTNSALVVQRWWRSFRIKLVRNRIKKYRILQERSAIIIQKTWRGYKQRQIIKLLRFKYNRAAKIIQILWKQYRQQKLEKVYLQNCAALCIQKVFKSHMFLIKLRVFIKGRIKSIVCIQRAFRAFLSMKLIRAEYVRLKNATLFIQRMYRTKLLLKNTQNDFQKLKSAAIIIQTRFRAQRTMIVIRENYRNLLKSVRIVQSKYRAKLAMRKEVKNYSNIKQSAVIIQRWYRSQCIMLFSRAYYDKLKKASLVIQRRFRAQKLMRYHRKYYVELKKVTMFVQRKYRARKSMLIAKNNYHNLKKSVVMIQSKFRALQAMLSEKNKYNKLRHATIVIQNRFRAQLIMKTYRKQYIELREQTIFVQRKHRARKAMFLDKNYYQQLQKAAVIIQRRFRAQQTMLIVKNNYQKLRKASLTIQILYKAKYIMRICRNNYKQLKNAAIIIQQRYRARRAMLLASNEYEKLKYSAIIIQRRFRAQKEMIIARANYYEMRQSILKIQRRYKAKIMMRNAANMYENLRNATIIIQNRFRAQLSMKIVRKKYLLLKQSVMFVQAKYRAKLAMRKAKFDYDNLKRYTIMIQRKYREKCLLKIALAEYKSLKHSAIIIQSRFRAHIIMVNERNFYHLLKRYTIEIQRKFRAKKMLKLCRSEYLYKRQCVVQIQIRFRAMLIMRKTKMEFEKLKFYTLRIQRYFRAQCQMKIDRRNFLQLKNAAINIQRRFRAQLKMKKQLHEYICLKKQIIIVQQIFRAKRNAKIVYDRYQLFKKYVVIIQRRFRAKLARIAAKKRLIALRNAAICIQIRWRATLAMRRDFNRYKMLYEIVLKIQRKFRSLHAFLPGNGGAPGKFVPVRAIIKIQAWWRGIKVRQNQSDEVKEVSNRLREVLNVTESEFTVGNMIEIALGSLLGYGTKAQTIDELETLEYCTRVCPSLCISQATEISYILYAMIIKNNRSIPDLRVALQSSEILINIVKYTGTIKSVLLTSQIPELILAASRICDKEVQLFCNVCTIIWIFGKNSETNMILRPVLLTSDCLQALNLTARKITRWYLMQSNVKKGHSYNKTLSKILPATNPDYGLPRKQPRTFSDPKFALQCIFKTLDLPVVIL